MPLSDQYIRRDKRVTLATRTSLRTGSGSGSLIEDASTIDLSGSGVRLRLCGQVVPGQIVEVFLSKRPERCRVVWTSSDRANKELIAGLEFTRPLPDLRSPQTPPSSGCESIN